MKAEQANFDPTGSNLELAKVKEKPAASGSGSSFLEAGTRSSAVGLINCVGVLQQYLVTHQLLSYDPSTVSWITPAQVFFMVYVVSW
ncbi:hypothetical protein FQN49_005157 [Arthroderma sp. PD_2]|nr:hypothetical protein FQN49_005157 [Arthroderma sp. PD_2]